MMWRRLLVLTLACLLHPALAGPASAHVVLISSTPTPGSVLRLPPQQVTLVFGNPVGDELARIEVVGPGARDVTTGPTRVAGSSVSRSLLADMGSGSFVVEWSAVAADGHTRSGDFTFTITPSAEPESSRPAEEIAAGGAGASDVVQPSRATGNAALPILAAMLVATGALSTAAMLARRRVTSRP